MNFKKITASSLLLAGIAMSPHALAEQSVHGHTINAPFGIWAGDDVSDQPTIDKLYDWAESKYPEFFPTHQDSIDINGYYARYYPESCVYIASLEGSLYVYGTPFSGLLELGTVSYWVEQMELDAKKATLNQLYDWVESQYPEYFTTHQDSFYIYGFYARFYQQTDVYIGSLGGSLYMYGTPFGGLKELGTVSSWVKEMKKETGNK